MCVAVRCMSSLDPLVMVQHAKQLENTLWILLNPKVLTWFPAWKNLAEYKMWQKLLQTTKQCSVMFVAFPTVVDD